MLKKLIKKDFRATARTFLPMILGFVVVSILAKILFEAGFMSSVNNNFISDTNEFMVVSSVIFIALYIIYVIAFFILTYVFIVNDFYQTMVSDQAYLTHTLPVKTSALINSKLIIAIFWQCVVYLLVFLSFLLFLMGHMPQIPWQEIATDFYGTLGMEPRQYTTFMIVCMVIGAFSSPLMLYASVAIGHLFGKHKVLGAILSYIGIYTVMQIICTIAMVAFGYSFTAALNANTAFNQTFYSTFFNSYMWFAIIFSTVTSIIFYIITNYVMRKKLNLE